MCDGCIRRRMLAQNVLCFFVLRLSISIICETWWFWLKRVTDYKYFSFYPEKWNVLLIELHGFPPIKLNLLWDTNDGLAHNDTHAQIAQFAWYPRSLLQTTDTCAHSLTLGFGNLEQTISTDLRTFVHTFVVHEETYLPSSTELMLGLMNKQYAQGPNKLEYNQVPIDTTRTLAEKKKERKNDDRISQEPKRMATPTTPEKWAGIADDTAVVCLVMLSMGAIGDSVMPSLGFGNFWLQLISPQFYVKLIWALTADNGLSMTSKVHGVHEMVICL